MVTFSIEIVHCQSQMHESIWAACLLNLWTFSFVLACDIGLINFVLIYLHFRYKVNCHHRLIHTCTIVFTLYSLLQLFYEQGFTALSFFIAFFFGVALVIVALLIFLHFRKKNSTSPVSI